MRILLVHNFYKSSAPSGEDIVFRQERDLLQSSGFEVVTYERHSDEIDEGSLSALTGTAVSAAWSRQTYRDIGKLIDETAPDVAHFHNTFPLISPSAYAACKERRVPVVQTLHNYRLICPGALLLREGQPCEKCVGATLLPALRYRCYRNSLAATASVVGMLARNRLAGTYRSSVNCYIALTQFAAERMIAGGLPQERIRVKPNFLPDPPAPRRKAAEPYAVYVGRLRKEKGVATLLRAWRRLPGVPLHVLGDGEQREELQYYAVEHALNVEFLGRCNRQKVLEMVGGAAVQVIPSEWYEGFPLVILEAYACGTAVVASDIGSLRELIVPGTTGYLFEPGNPDDLADKVVHMMSADRAGQIGQGARSMFSNKYTADANLARIKEIYAECRASLQ